jgi:dTDP-glucose 4,6-dehydratase
MYVEDHCAGIDLVLHDGLIGEAYNIGTDIEINGLTLVDRVLSVLEKPESLRQFVTDRPGHDLRYSLDCTKIGALGWQPRFSFDEMMDLTVRWYQENEFWWRAIKEEDSYKSYYKKQYEERSAQ